MIARDQQLALDLPIRQAMGREDFLVTESNRAAVELIDQWPNWPSYGAILVGPGGSGKSHLAEIFRQRSSAQVALMSRINAEEVLAAPAVNLVVEDVDQAVIDERALFHILNIARQQKSFVLLTAKSSPSAWGVKLPDLSSRLAALPAVRFLVPDDALLRGVLVKQFGDRQIAVTESTVSYLVQRMPRSLEAARAIAAEIDRQSLAERADVTRAFVSKVLQDFENPELFNSEHES